MIVAQRGLFPSEVQKLDIVTGYVAIFGKREFFWAFLAEPPCKSEVALPSHFTSLHTITKGYQILTKVSPFPRTATQQAGGTAAPAAVPRQPAMKQDAEQLLQVPRAPSSADFVGIWRHLTPWGQLCQAPLAQLTQLVGTPDSCFPSDSEQYFHRLEEPLLSPEPVSDLWT